MKISDTVLLERWIDHRDAEAFSQIVARHSSMVYSTCLRILRNSSDAEEVAQECFISLIRTEHSMIVSLGGWLHTLATRHSINKLKSHQCRVKREEEYVKENGGTNELDLDDAYVYVDEAIAELPEKLRHPVVSHFLEGLTHKEIAESLDISRTTVTSRIAKGIDTVRRRLKRRGVIISVSVLSSILTVEGAQAAPTAMTANLGKFALLGGKAAVNTAAAGSKISTLTSIITIGGIIMTTKKIIAVTLILAALICGGYVIKNPPPEAATPQSKEPLESPKTVIRNQVQQSPTVAKSIETPIVPTSAKGMISGMVYTGSTRTGVPGIEVCATGTHSATPKSFFATTDTKGYYKLKDLNAGNYSLSIAGAVPENALVDYKPVRATLPPGVDKVNVNLSMPPGLALSGIVVDDIGHPVVGAKVTFFEYPAVREKTSTTTKEGGRFSFHSLMPSQNIYMSAEFESLTSDILGPVQLTKDDSAEIRLVVSPAASISGRVVDKLWQPISNVNVEISLLTAAPGVYMELTDTTAQGAFSFDKLLPGKYRIQALPKGLIVSTDKAEYLELSVRKGEIVNDAVLVMKDAKGESIAGRVTDPNGKPIVELPIECYGQEGYRKCLTDHNGRYEVSGLISGMYRILLRSPRYPEDDLEVKTGTMDADFVLEPFGSIIGKVVDAETNMPIENFVVGLAPIAEEGNPMDAYLRPVFNRVHNREGMYDIPLTMKKGYIKNEATVVVGATGYEVVSQELAELPVGNATVELNFQLKPRNEITGIVTDMQGRPVPNARIYQGEFPGNYILNNALALTDVEGKFKLTLGLSDESRLCAYHPEYAPGYGIISTSSVGNSSIEIRLASGGRIEGTVTKSNSPVPHMRVSVWYPRFGGIGRCETITDEKGHYAFEGLSEGTVEVFVSIDGNMFKNEAIIENYLTTEVDFQVDSKANSTIEGSVLVAGKPTHGIWLEIIHYAEGYEATRYGRIDAEGMFREENFVPGPVTITASYMDENDNHLMRKVYIELGPDSTERVDLDLRSGFPLNGEVGGLRDDDQANVTVFEGSVEIQDVSEETMSMLEPIMLNFAEVNDDGSFYFPSLDFGEYTFLVMAHSQDEKRDVGSPTIETSYRYGFTHAVHNQEQDAFVSIEITN